MSLTDALWSVKLALADEHVYYEHPGECPCIYCSSRRLVGAVLDHLAAERKSAETLLCLADLQRHGGE